jgi:hypothetical protein
MRGWDLGGLRGGRHGGEGDLLPDEVLDGISRQDHDPVVRYACAYVGE